MIGLRSFLYWIVSVVATIVFAFISLLTFPLHPLNRYKVISQWSRLMLWWLEKTCGVHYQVIGADNIPATPVVIMAKHQSAWETLALQLIFPPHVWVLKRELTWIPFFGWGLAMLNPISINRSSKQGVIQQVLEQGQQRLETGFCVVVFPEGTRVKAGTRRKYKLGGAKLAIHTGRPIVPIAHNAGELWPRRSFLKYPGTISVIIGKPIYPDSENAAALTKQVEDWIETEMQQITGKAHRDSERM